MLTDEDRRPYVIRSEKLREEHMRRHPDYKYRPKKKAKEAEKQGNQNTTSNQQQHRTVLKNTTSGINNNLFTVDGCRDSNAMIKLGPGTTLALNGHNSKNITPATTILNNQHLLKPITTNNAVLQKIEGAKIVNIKNGQCVMTNAKPFLTLSRQVGKIGSLSSSEGNFSISPQKNYTMMKTTSFASGQKMLRTSPLTPPPNVPGSLGSPVDFFEPNLSFYDDFNELFESKKNRCNSSSSSSTTPGNDFHTAPTWTQCSESGDSGVDFPVSPLSDIMDLPDIYTTPEVSELLSGQWLDGSLGI